MFTGVTETAHKSHIIDSFKADGTPPGSGGNCRIWNECVWTRIRQVVHIKMPDDTISNYIQESEKAGRDGKPAMASPLKARIDHQVGDDIKEYVANSSMCRQDALLVL